MLICHVFFNYYFLKNTFHTFLYNFYKKYDSILIFSWKASWVDILYKHYRFYYLKNFQATGILDRREGFFVALASLSRRSASSIDAFSKNNGKVDIDILTLSLAL